MPRISDLTVDTSPTAASRVPAVEASGTVAYALSAIAALLGIILETRDPTTSDTSYKAGTRWVNTSTGDLFMCFDQSSGLWGGLGASENLASHLADVANPHGVTKSQVGLGSVANILHKLNATAAPTVNDDEGDGYAAGSMWVDVTNGKAYICTDASSGAADWYDPSASGSTVTTVTVTPGATWTPTLADNTVYLVTLSQNCAITLGSGVTGNAVHMSSIYLDRQGYTATIENADDTDASVTLNAASGTIEMLAVEHRIVASEKHYHVWQVGTEGGSAGSALPSSGLATEYLFTSDATDNIGSNDLTLENGASVTTTGDKGLSLTAASSQYADVASLVVNTDLDFTIYVAFNHANATSGSDEQVLGWGRQAAGGSYLDVYYDDGISKFRVITKDTDGVNGSGCSVNYADCPSGWQLWKVMRSGSTLTLECLTNGASAIGTPPPGSMSLDALAVGCRYVNTSPSRYYDGVIGWAAFYSRAVTSSSEDAQVADYVETTRALNVLP